MGGGTVAFVNLNGHCEFSGFHKLDSLPFNCNLCSKICLGHKSCKSHECLQPKKIIKELVVCGKCSTVMGLLFRN